MRVPTAQAIRTATACLLLLGLTAIPAEAAKKPPPAGSADPRVTFIDGYHLYVCNADGSNKVVIHQDRDVYIREPKMGPDRRSVVFVAATPGSAVHRIRRTHFAVVNGSIQPGPTETIVAAPLMPWEVALSPQGDRVAFVLTETLYELEICALPPCDLAEAVALYTPPPERWVQPIGGYSANGLAYFFEESGPAEAFDPAFLRLDRTTGAVDRVLTVPAEPGSSAIATWLEPGPIDYGGLESRLLFDSGDALYVFDTRTGELSGPLGEGHHATWSPDETQAISVRSFRGPLLKVDLATGQATQVVKFGGEPNWR